MAEAGCEESYGFLPCSESLGGSVFLMVMYGFILLKGAGLLSDGSELLLEILNPGVIGGLVLPILGALPDTMIILFSGQGTREQAQEQVAVGVGTLAGSTVMLLTIAWGGSVWLGRCDLSKRRGVAKDKTLTRPRCLTTTGVTSDSSSQLNAKLMMASALLYLTIQIPCFMHLGSSTASLVGSVLCILTLIAYCIYQIAYPELQKRRMERAEARRQRQLDAASALHKSAGGLLDEHGNVVEAAVKLMFDEFDADRSGHIDHAELRALLLSIAIIVSDKREDHQAELDFWMKEFDADQSGHISEAEFLNGVKHFFATHKASKEKTITPVSDDEDEESGSAALIPGHKGADDDDEEDEHPVPLTPKQIAMRAAGMLLAGTLICAVFSDPMVGAVSAFSKASGIPSFFVAFIITPLASNSSELVSSLQFAARKRVDNISLTFGQVYGAVTMNNTMCLGLFLFVVHRQGLTWTYTGEVAVIVGVTLLVGMLGMSRTTFHSYWAVLVFALYPLSIIAVYVCDYVFMLDQQ